MPHPKKKGPTFICVGPEKTGTTWLFRTLSPHPDLFLAPPKEMRYFIENILQPNESWFDRLFITKGWWRWHYRRYLMSRPKFYLSNTKHMLESWRFAWDWRYVFGRHNDEWYLGAFDVPEKYHVTGEICPPYFFMPDEGVAHVRRLCPDAKIILFVRNPIDWCWSFAKMTFLKNPGKKFEDVKEEDFLDFFTKKLTENSFSDSIKRWRKHFPEEQIYISFFDSLAEAPLAVHGEVCRFLGLDQQRMSPTALEQISKKINQGVARELPPALASALVALCKEDMDELCRMFEGYPQRWRADADRRLAIA